MRTLPALTCLALLSGCGANLFTLQDDIDLGKQLRDEINADPKTYPVVDPKLAPDAYEHLERMLAAVLSSEEVIHANDFEWEIYLIDDDKTLNAFAAPGGYVWVYSGLMRFLDQEDDLVGVLGHEVAHADLRHGTEKLTEQYGITVLLELLLGENPGLLGEVAGGLTGLAFSRGHETESDEFSVHYLCDTDYASNGAAAFFEKLEKKGKGAGIPAFLSTHPSSPNRVAEINALATQLGCSTDPNPGVPTWETVLGTLP